jgi:hypothetical protein
LRAVIIHTPDQGNRGVAVPGKGSPVKRTQYAGSSLRGPPSHLAGGALPRSAINAPLKQAVSPENVLRTPVRIAALKRTQAIANC